MRVLVLGGTSEARALADRLVGLGVDTVSSLAGRVSRPALPAGETRIGGFGGADGLERYLHAEGIERVVDATHPFATTISRNAFQACARAGVPLLALRRPVWKPVPGDRWTWVANLPAAAAVVRARPLGGTVFLSVGRDGAAAFAGDEHDFLLRSVEPPDGARPPRLRFVTGRGPFTVAEEERLLREHGVVLVVTRDSGGSATAAKLTAARRLGVEVLVVARPEPVAASSVSDVEKAVEWVLGVIR